MQALKEENKEAMAGAVYLTSRGNEKNHTAVTL